MNVQKERAQLEERISDIWLSKQLDMERKICVIILGIVLITAAALGYRSYM